MSNWKEKFIAEAEEQRHLWRAFSTNLEGECSETPDEVFMTAFLRGASWQRHQMEALLDECEKIIKQCTQQMKFSSWNEEPIYEEMKEILIKLRERKAELEGKDD